MSVPPIEAIEDDFSMLEDWEDRYRYLIDLGHRLDPLPDAARSGENKVRGCVSQVWLETAVDRRGSVPVLNFRGDSDAHIVRGLVALALSLYSGRTAPAILKTDALDIFNRFGLAEHLTPQRSNGVRALIERIRGEAARALDPGDNNRGALSARAQCD